ncbi:MAG: putative diguanylate cyclase YdaM [Pelotomaculum sp. PtaU1.Bin065]|nr:MAG: putative diguanylate cyclase YdaM [Pelotomaculum sp. PtaU1.Bin065]
MLQSEAVQARRKSKRFSLVLIDPELLQPFHNPWGRQAREHVQGIVAKVIKRVLLEGDNVVRYRGEGFLIFLPNAGSLTALLVADMIRRAVERTKWPGGMTVTVSAGVASYPDDGERLTELLKNLESALSRAKSEGRNQVHCVSVRL